MLLNVKIEKKVKVAENMIEKKETRSNPRVACSWGLQIKGVCRRLLTDRYGNLALGRRVRGPLDALASLIEDPGYAVGLGEYGAVAEAQAESEADPQTGAVPFGRLAQDHEAHEVAGEDADEQHVA